MKKSSPARRTTFAIFLRGINVGGKRIVKMADLREALSEAGFEDVRTYIQSGNVIVKSAGSATGIARKAERILEESFDVGSKAIVKSRDELGRILARVPASWAKGNGIRKYIAFVKSDADVSEFVRTVKPREGVDSFLAGDGAVYLSAKISEITKSSLSKIVGTPVYKKLTLRNHSTALKVFDMMVG